MGLIVHNFEISQGFILPSGYYKVDNINWDLTTNDIYCVFHLYTSKDTALQGKAYFPLETINYHFVLDSQDISDLPNTCYAHVIGIIQQYNEVEAAIATYEANENNYTIIYDEETGEEIERTLIPNDLLYGQRIPLPSGFEKLLNAIQD